MKKSEIKKLLKEKCTDFLNCEKGCEMPGYPKERFTGFYVEVEDVADILSKVTEERELKLVSSMMDTFGELKHFDKTRIPRCPHCKKNFVKVEEQSGEYHSQWKPDCGCIKRDLRMCIG